jgi:hypothetical protein
VEFETAADLKKAVEALDGREFKDQRVTCVANVGDPSMQSSSASLPSPLLISYRPSLTSRHETAAVDPAHQVPVVRTLHGKSSWTVVAPLAVGVPAATTATEALLVATTTKTVRDTAWMITRRLAVAPWMITPLLGAVAWMIIRLPVAVLSMTTLRLRETFLLEKPGTPGKADTTLRAITTAVTGNLPFQSLNPRGP